MSHQRRVCYQDSLPAELFDDPAARATAPSADPFEGHLQAYQQLHKILTKESIRE